VEKGRDVDRGSNAEAYLLDNRQAEAGVRIEALSAIFDPSTFRHIERLGIAEGWRCWEVGAGGLSVPTWLAKRVGPAGRVLATDIDISWMKAANEPTIEVRRHDVAGDEPPAEAFDLVHARLVLVHLVDRAKALESLVKVLAPGGWLFLEDADPALQPLVCPDEHGPEQQLANRLRNGFRALLAMRGADLAYGRKLPRLLRAAGLVDVEADGFFPLTSPASNRLEKATIEQIRPSLLAGGFATDEEIARHLVHIASGSLDLATSPLVSAWGRRP
jgi:SAM-dependent methyltransferase